MGLHHWAYTLKSLAVSALALERVRSAYQIVSHEKRKSSKGHGSRRPQSPFSNHACGTHPRYWTGIGSAPAASSSRVPVSTALQGASRKAGHRFGGPPQDYFRTWLLLASPSALPLCNDSQDACSVLDRQIQGQPQARSRKPPGSARARMEQPRCMAVSIEAAKKSREETP